MYSSFSSYLNWKNLPWGNFEIFAWKGQTKLTSLLQPTAAPEADISSRNIQRKSLKVVSTLPDGDDLPKVELVIIHLGDEDGCHGLVESSAVHVDGGPDGQHEADDAPVDVVVL